MSELYLTPHSLVDSFALESPMLDAFPKTLRRCLVVNRLNLKMEKTFRLPYVAVFNPDVWFPVFYMIFEHG